MVGGRKPSRIASSVKAASMAPAAPSMCPVTPFVEETGTSYARSSPSATLSARVSAESPAGVDVPCALM